MLCIINNIIIILQFIYFFEMWLIHYPFIKDICELTKILIYYNHIVFFFNEMKD